jgi:predicted ABC-type ATPase
MTMMEWLNPDEVSKELLRRRGGFDFQTASAELLQSTFIEAADLVFARAKKLIESGNGLCVETVLSTAKYRPLVEATLQQDGFFGLVYVAVRSPEVSAERIAARFEQGGHDVPTDRLAARWQRSLEQLPWFASRAHFMHVYDNTRSDRQRLRPQLIARKRLTSIQIVEPDLISELTAALRRIE